MFTRFTRSLPAALVGATILAMSMLFTGAAHASATATISFDGPPNFDSGRAFQLLALRGLEDAGVRTSAPESMAHPLSIEQAIQLAREAGASRHFHLTVAPLRTGAVVDLEEVSLEDGSRVFRESMQMLDDMDADRTLGRLTAAVVARRSASEGQRMATVTAAEAMPHAKLPGEFYYGIGLSVGVTKGGGGGPAAIYGVTASAEYQTPHFGIGATLGIMGNEVESFGWDITIHGDYFFVDSNWSPFVRAGLGFGGLDVEGVGDATGMHAIAGVGIEGFRLHAARLRLGLEVLLPFYQLEERYWLGSGFEERGTRTHYVPIPRLSMTVMF